MADSAFTLMPRYGTLTELNNNLNKINNGDLCFTTDSNQEFIKINEYLYPVVGTYKKYEVTFNSETTIAPIDFPQTEAELSSVSAEIKSITIPQMNKAIIHICPPQDQSGIIQDFDTRRNLIQWRISPYQENSLMFGKRGPDRFTLQIFVLYEKEAVI